MVFQQGFIFTDSDLKGQLAKNSYEAAGCAPFEEVKGSQREQAIATSPSVQSQQKVRNVLTSGVVLTEKDLRERMASGGDDGVANLDQVRGALGKAKRYSFLPWVVPLFLIVVVSLIGGRSIPGKVLWVASFILVLSVVLIVAAGPGYKNAARPRIMEGLQQSISENSAGDPISMGLIRDKTVQAAGRAADDFAAGIVIQGYALLILSMITIVVAVWLLHSRRAMLRRA